MTNDLHATFGHRNDLYSAALLYFYAPHHNPEPANLNPEPFTSLSLPLIARLILPSPLPARG